jgi:hypothetical protein
MSYEGTQKPCFSCPMRQTRFTNGRNSHTSFQPSSYIYHNGGKRQREGETVQQAPPQQARQQVERFTSSPATHEGHLTAFQDRLPESSVKRARCNSYKEPRIVPPSILTATGSLVGGICIGASSSHGSGSNPVTVPFRRQLSSGALDSFLGGHDGMDLETNDQSRTRSMSF